MSRTVTQFPQLVDQLSDDVPLENAVKLFYLEMHRYPTNDEGLAVLTTKSGRGPAALIEVLPLDPWEQPYDDAHPGARGPG